MPGCCRLLLLPPALLGNSNNNTTTNNNSNDTNNDTNRNDKHDNDKRASVAASRGRVRSTRQAAACFAIDILYYAILYSTRIDLTAIGCNWSTSY